MYSFMRRLVYQRKTWQNFCNKFRKRMFVRHSEINSSTQKSNGICMNWWNNFTFKRKRRNINDFTFVYCVGNNKDILASKLNTIFWKIGPTCLPYQSASISLLKIVSCLDGYIWISIFFTCMSRKIFKKGQQEELSYSKLKNNSRAILIKWPFSRTFSVQKKFRTIQGIPEPLATLEFVFLKL